MSVSDGFNRPADRVLRSPGTGLPLRRLCWGCNKPKGQEGGRKWGPLRLWCCGECVTAKEKANA